MSVGFKGVQALEKFALPLFNLLKTWLTAKVSEHFQIQPVSDLGPHPYINAGRSTTRPSVREIPRGHII